MKIDKNDPIKVPKPGQSRGAGEEKKTPDQRVAEAKQAQENAQKLEQWLKTHKDGTDEEAARDLGLNPFDVVLARKFLEDASSQKDAEDKDKPTSPPSLGSGNALENKIRAQWDEDQKK